MKTLKLAGIVVFLLFVFTIVEYVTLYYWLQFGNTDTGLSILFTGLFLEHAISLIAGVIAGMALSTVIAKGLEEFTRRTTQAMDLSTGNTHKNTTTTERTLTLGFTTTRTAYGTKSPDVVGVAFSQTSTKETT
jgi:hypothetical protein